MKILSVLLDDGGSIDAEKVIVWSHYGSYYYDEDVEEINRMVHPNPYKKEAMREYFWIVVLSCFVVGSLGYAVCSHWNNVKYLRLAYAKKNNANTATTAQSLL